MRWKLGNLDSYASRVRRSSREIVIASVLTLAALGFLIAALLGSTVPDAPKVGAVASDGATIK